VYYARKTKHYVLFHYHAIKYNGLRGLVVEVSVFVKEARLKFKPCWYMLDLT